ncbi:hypothetical protein R3P38DRAFT_3238210 [Favolaschia claudopus]|uniref:Uncharacterized protein n=1 Tax=Favolaschia claudopus TaxID=2862362 RepID=A0AAV9ZA57_9AGAR
MQPTLGEKQTPFFFTLAFFATNDVRDHMLSFLPLVALMTYRQVNSMALYHVMEITRRRVMRYTAPFFCTTGERDVFFHVLDDLHSWIIGPVALAVLSFGFDPAAPSHLTVISSRHSERAWIDFMCKVLHFKCKSYIGGRGVHPLAHQLMVFNHPKVPGRFVTVTTPRESSFHELFLNGSSTLMTNAVSAQEIICTYVDLTSNFEGVYGFAHANTMDIMPIGPVSAIPVPASDRPCRLKPRTPFEKGVKLHVSTRVLGRPCGLACPALRRISTDLEGIGHWRWGGLDRLYWEEDENLNKMASSDIQYCTGVVCRNTLCENFSPY